MEDVSRFWRGTVTRIVGERRGLQRVEVDGAPADVLMELVGAVRVGDNVVLNLDPVELALAAGASPIVHWNLEHDSWGDLRGPHVLKLRYTSFQTDAGVAEEFERDHPWPRDLDGCAVAVCPAHDHIGGAVAELHRSQPGSRVAFVMTEGGALALALSDVVAHLVEAGDLVGTVTAGQAFGGDVEAVNVPSALLVAKATYRPDAIVVTAGPLGRAGESGASQAAARARAAVALLDGRLVPFRAPVPRAH